MVKIPKEVYIPYFGNFKGWRYLNSTCESDTVKRV